MNAGHGIEQVLSLLEQGSDGSIGLVTVAMANRAARAIWAIMVRGEVYLMPALGSATA